MSKSKSVSTAGLHKVTLQITQDIIDSASPANTGRCMVAVAIRRQGGSSVNVTSESVRFNRDGKRFVFQLPALAAANIRQFDIDRSKVAPFECPLRNGVAAPIAEYPHRRPRGPTQKRKRKQSGARFCPRRFHGTKITEDQAAEFLDLLEAPALKRLLAKKGIA